MGKVSGLVQENYPIKNDVGEIRREGRTRGRRRRNVTEV
jgi:hypothetical protein